MKTKILITWTSSWIWKYFSQVNNKKYEIIWISRNKSNIDNICEYLWDINNEDFLLDVSRKIDNIDYLILNAWVWYFDNFSNLSIKQHKEIINTNLLSNIILTSLLKDKINKWIIFMWSHSSKKSQKNWSSYMASKFWLRWFAMWLKNDLKLKIHIINPKIVKTNFHKSSKIDILWKFEETNIQDIINLIDNIISQKEKRFEIDL